MSDLLGSEARSSISELPPSELVQLFFLFSYMWKELTFQISFV